jgi:hypothetical protein
MGETWRKFLKSFERKIRTTEGAKGSYSEENFINDT